MKTQKLQIKTRPKITAIALVRARLRHEGGIVFEAHRLCVSLNSRLESKKEEEEEEDPGRGIPGSGKCSSQGNITG